MSQNLPYSNVQPPVRGLSGIMAKVQAIEPERRGLESRVYLIRTWSRSLSVRAWKTLLVISPFRVNVRIRETACAAWNREDTH